MNYWVKLLTTITSKAITFKDEPVIEMCQRLMKVPDYIKQHVLKKFIIGCRTVYAVGFFQWRLNCETQVLPDIKYYDKEGELLELISKYIELKQESPQYIDI